MIVERILVIAEKPDAARKIAQALSRSRQEFEKSEVIDVLDSFDGNHYFVTSAFGHLYEVEDSQPNRGLYPSLDIDWFLRSSSGRYQRTNSLFSRRIKLITSLATRATMLVNACDFDTEGETIGSNILEFAVQNSKNKIWRAKFSTLTSDEIRDSFSALFSSDRKLTEAGRMRNVADFLWGVNMSRALTGSVQKENGNIQSYLTIGRVQGPTLSFVVDREIDRLIHVPLPSWSLNCILGKDGTTFSARFVRNSIRNERKAKELHATVSSANYAIVRKIEKSFQHIPPRYPFDLGELQKESFRLFGLSPSVTLSTAQRLYQDALISYPRTDSQKLPEKIGYEKIFQKLSVNGGYSILVSKLLANPLKRKRPFEGPQEDPAHPAIFPTGENSKRELKSLETKVLNLIVRRFLNSFSSDAILEKAKIIFDVSSMNFETQSEKLVAKGWTEYYPHPFTVSGLRVDFTEGEEVRVESSDLAEHFEPMAARYNESSLLSKMELEQIGTKGTRADTIATLVDRKYLSKAGRDLIPSDLAINLVTLLKNKTPKIVSVEMTRELERKLDRIRFSLGDDLEFVELLLDSLRNELRILRGTSIPITAPSLKIDLPNPDQELGVCPRCKWGKLRLITSKTTGKRFIRCSNFATCKTSSPSFPRGKISSTGISCTICKWPMITVFENYRKGLLKCSNYYCKSIFKRENSD